MGHSFLGKNINVEMRVDSPKIVLDSNKSIFIIEGPSYPEDAFEVYDCVLHWLKQNNYQFENQLNCEFKFKVLNSSSRKMIVEILIALEMASQKNRNIRVLWYFEKYDEDMMQAGEDLADNIDIPFDFISI